jgi:hypothetical protein
MGQNLPKYINPRLESLASEIAVLRNEAQELRKHTEVNYRKKTVLEGELKEATYGWCVHYELEIESSGRREWLSSPSIVGVEHYGEEFVETESEARAKIHNAKKNIRDLMGKNVNFDGLFFKGEDGTVVDTNIKFVLLTKGECTSTNRDGTLYKREKPTKAIY